MIYCVHYTLTNSTVIYKTYKYVLIIFYLKDSFGFTWFISQEPKEKKEQINPRILKMIQLITNQVTSI